MTPADIIKTVIDSGLRGRGGAGFSAGQKWSFIPKEKKGPHYLAVNADESEPGTFKDRYLIDYDPHQMLEGIAIAAHRHAGATSPTSSSAANTTGRRRCSSTRSRKPTTRASSASRGSSAANTSSNATSTRGAGAYICGEETGLLEALEGKRGWPRNKPPFPAIAGAFAKPTVINNVETLCCVPHIIERGDGPSGSSPWARPAPPAPSSTACPATSTSPASTKTNSASRSTTPSTNSPAA